MAVGPGGCWKREQRVLSPCLWAGDTCAGHPMGLVLMLRVCRMWGSPIPRALSPPPPSCLPAPVFPSQVARGLYNVLKPRNSSSRYTTTQPATGGGEWWGGFPAGCSPCTGSDPPLYLQCSAPGVVHWDCVPFGEGDLIVTVIPLLLHVLNNCFYL